jgi:hypothetical protein
MRVTIATVLSVFNDIVGIVSRVVMRSFGTSEPESAGEVCTDRS